MTAELRSRDHRGIQRGAQHHHLHSQRRPRADRCVDRRQLAGGRLHRRRAGQLLEEEQLGGHSGQLILLADGHAGGHPRHGHRLGRCQKRMRGLGAKEEKSGAPPSERSSRRIAWYCAGFEIRCPQTRSSNLSDCANSSSPTTQGRLLKLHPPSMEVCAGVHSPFASSPASALLAAWGLNRKLGQR